MIPAVFLIVPPLKHRREIIHPCHCRAQLSEQGLCLFFFFFESQTRAVLCQQRGGILYIKQGGQGLEKPLLTIAQSNFSLNQCLLSHTVEIYKVIIIFTNKYPVIFSSNVSGFICYNQKDFQLFVNS